MHLNARAALEEKNVLIELRSHIYLISLKPWSIEQAASKSVMS